MTGNGYMSLRKSDLQNFFKRLRFNTKRKTIKYYACGEYGGKGSRPHYHAIIFDASPDEIDAAWVSPDPSDPVRLGFCHYGQVTDDSIAYTAKYMAKESRIPMHDADDRLPEFSLMSKRLGANYLTPAVIQYHKEGFKSFLMMPGGATHAMPRYYRDRIFSEAERAHMNIGLSDKFDRVFEENVKLAGSVEEYYRALHYAVRATNKQFNENNKRNKI